MQSTVQTKNRRPRIFYGWWIVSCAVLLQSVFLIVSQATASVFLRPVVEELGWQVWQFSLGSSLAVLAGALSASCFGFESSSYFTADGAPPRAGQLLIAIDPGPFSEGRFGARLEDLLAAIEEQPGTRLPGQRRYALREQAEREGVTIPRGLHEELSMLRG